jgi:hypothetical protein
VPGSSTTPGSICAHQQLTRASRRPQPERDRSPTCSPHSRRSTASGAIGVCAGRRAGRIRDGCCPPPRAAGLRSSSPEGTLGLQTTLKPSSHAALGSSTTLSYRGSVCSTSPQQDPAEAAARAGCRPGLLLPQQEVDGIFSGGRLIAAVTPHYEPDGQTLRRSDAEHKRSLFDSRLPMPVGRPVRRQAEATPPSDEPLGAVSRRSMIATARSRGVGVAVIAAIRRPATEWCYPPVDDVVVPRRGGPRGASI